MAGSNYYLGQDYADALGGGPRYFYALRRNVDGELYFLRSDQLTDQEAIELNIPGDPVDNFEDFENGVDYLEGIAADHEIEHPNLKYQQYRWDSRSMLYYINSEGMLIVRIGKGYTYPTGISSNG